MKQQINLYQPIERAAITVEPPLNFKVVVIIFMLLLLIIVFLSGYAYQQVYTREQKLQAMQAYHKTALDRLSRYQKTQATLKNTAPQGVLVSSQQKRLLDVLKQANKNGYANKLEDIFISLDEHIMLFGIDMSYQAITLTGDVDNIQVIPDFLQRLSAQPSFKKDALNLLQMKKEVKTIDKIHFMVSTLSKVDKK